MNIIDIQDQLKNFSENQLIQEMQMPSGMAPQFLVLSEIQRRKRVRDDFAKRQAAGEPTVAQEAVAAAGVPVQGIAGMSEAMAPQSAASGGIGSIMPRSMRQPMPSQSEQSVPMAEGGLIESLFKGRDSMSEATQRPDVRRHKDGRLAMYKPGTNIFLGFAKEEEMYDGGLIRAQDGLPRGLRLRNPGNIRPGAGFYGEVGDDGEYAQFASDEAGIRAIQRLLRTYGNEYGINTLRGLANRYAPPSENPTSNYIDFLSQQTGINPDEEINLAERGSQIVPAIIGFEQGQQPFSQELIDRAIGAAEFDDEEKIMSALQPSKQTVAENILSKLGLISSANASTMTQDLAQQASNSKPYTYPDFPTEWDGTVVEDGAVVMPPSVVLEEPAAEAPAMVPTFSSPTMDESGGTQTVVEDGAIVMKPGPIVEDVVPDISAFTPPEEEVAAQPPAPPAPPATTTSPAVKPPAPQRNVTYPDTAATAGTGIEDEIKKLQSQMEKSREQDKWLAIAQAGLTLMSSKEPTLLGAAGEAGVEGLKAFREAQSRYQEGVVDLINARAKMAGTQKGITASSAVSRINKIEELLNPTDPAAMPLDPATAQKLREEKQYLERNILLYPDITA